MAAKTARTASEIANLGSRSSRLKAFHDAAYPVWKASAPPWLRYDVLLAQALLETGGFTSDLFRRANNPFGMGWTSRPSVAGRDSVSSFYARYATLEDAIRDYIARQELFNSGRGTGGRRAFDAAQSAEEYVDLLNVAGRQGNYATAPGYNDAVKALLPEAKAVAPTNSGAPTRSPGNDTPDDDGQDTNPGSVPFLDTRAGKVAMYAAQLLVVGGLFYGVWLLYKRYAKKRKPAPRAATTTTEKAPRKRSTKKAPKAASTTAEKPTKPAKATGKKKPRADPEGAPFPGARKLKGKWYGPKEWGKKMAELQAAKRK